MKTAIKKSIPIVLAILVILPLTSCRALRMSINTEGEQKQLAEKILRCFDDRDSETLKGLFCEITKALPGLDEQIQAAFDFYEGKMVSYNDTYRVSTSDGRIYEKGKITSARSSGRINNIVTDADKCYAIHFYNYLISEYKGREGISEIDIFDKNSDAECIIGELIK